MWNFFGGNKNKGNIPPPTNLQTQKTKQIETLTKLNASQIIRDVEYRVTFQSQSSNISLIITLPPQFPQDPPTVKVSPAVYHPWVNQEARVVGCSGLNNFYMHSNLGDVIQSIIEEFKQHPPTVTQQQYGSELPPYQGTSLASVYPPYPHSVQTPAGQMVMPELSSLTDMKAVAQSENEKPDSSFPDCKIPEVMICFPDLQEKSATQLNELLNDEDTVMKMVQNLPDFVKLVEENEKLSDQCIRLAKENLSKKPLLESLKHNIIEKNQMIEKVKIEFEQDQEKHMTLSDQFHPANIQTNIQVAVMEAEEESEKIFENFLERKIDLDEFIQTFRHKRTLCHSRRAKEEKLSQIIRTHRY